SNTLLNPDLKPEQTTSTEGGLEIGLLNNRISIDASIYDKKTRDEITQVPVPGTSGFTSQLVNAGEIDNKGYEALLNLVPLQTGRWTWNSTINFSHNRGTVVSLNPGVTELQLGDFQGVADVYARVGVPYGEIRGLDVLRDANGVPILDNAGEWQPADTLQNFGSIQPDWIAGWTNSINYKSFTLGLTLDVRHGGKIFSGTNYYGQATGTLASTLYGREVDWNN